MTVHSSEPACSRLALIWINQQLFSFHYRIRKATAIFLVYRKQSMFVQRMNYPRLRYWAVTAQLKMSHQMFDSWLQTKPGIANTVLPLKTTVLHSRTWMIQFNQSRNVHEIFRRDFAHHLGFHPKNLTSIETKPYSAKTRYSNSVVKGLTKLEKPAEKSVKNLFSPWAMKIR